MTNDRRPLVTSCALVIVLFAGCTPGPAMTQSTTPSVAPQSSLATSSPATVTPTPTDSWNPAQAAAVKAVEGYYAARDELFADPSRFTQAEATKALEPYASTEMLEGNITLFGRLKKDQQRYEGEARLAWIETSGVFGSGVGESVNVTVCRDSTGRTWVDHTGKVLGRIPSGVREFEVRNTTSGFRIVGEKEGLGAACP
jgi:hypothetical protein